PALSALAAGLPALSALQDWPGVGLLLAPGPAPVAVWPAWGVAATLVVALAGAEVLARVLDLHHGETEPRRFFVWFSASARLRRGDPAARSDKPARDDLTGGEQAGVAGPGALVPEAARWAGWIDPARLIRAGAARRGA